MVDGKWRLLMNGIALCSLGLQRHFRHELNAIGCQERGPIFPYSATSSGRQILTTHSQEEERDNQVYWTVWIRWPGTSEPQKYIALVDTGAQCTIMPSNHRGTESVTIAGVTGGSQELTVLEVEKLIRQQESQGVINKTRSSFNNPIWPVRKPNGEWRLTVDYRGLNEVTPPLSAAVPDMLELHYELESKEAKGPTICHGLIQTALEKGGAPEHLQYIDDIIVWGNTAEEVFEKGEKETSKGGKLLCGVLLDESQKRLREWASPISLKK
ncbi:endogenous retrovirus group k member 19 pol [Limosa lapponica baueri]|uniref:Endogenous retrovirus group k member 19 pol n=1 Tax=Limosa lapponica baueri TaxID=1758121 RepID=A0A2I0T8P1_LIMLA|nr:endogenous retrovirus group k member 19 pol [Limosa lapponica baueri]